MNNTEIKARRVKETITDAFLMGAKVEVGRQGNDFANDSQTIVINWPNSSIQAIKMASEDREAFLKLL